MHKLKDIALYIPRRAKQELAEVIATPPYTHGSLGMTSGLAIGVIGELAFVTSDYLEALSPIPRFVTGASIFFGPLILGRRVGKYFDNQIGADYLEKWPFRESPAI